MARRIIGAKPITIPEAKRILEKVKEGELGEFQRRALEYAIKFSKLSASEAEELVEALVEKFELEEREAIQVANCMPKTVEELRTILAVKGRVITTSRFEEILETLKPYLDRKA